MTTLIFPVIALVVFSFGLWVCELLDARND